MAIKRGETKTRNGTDVVVDVTDFQLPSGRKCAIGHLKKLGEGHPQGVLVWNADGAIANLGYPSEECTGMSLDPSRE
jgi:hypothetical protein